MSLCERFPDLTCACNAETKWRHKRAKIDPLFIEYERIDGTGTLLNLNSELENSTYYSLTEINGKLKALPNNLCDFPGLVDIDVSQK